MALMPSIMSLFGGKAATPTTPANTATGQNPATPSVQNQQTTMAGANPTVPSATTPQSTGTLPAIPAAAEGAASPLANFQDFWKTDPNTSQTTPSLVPSFNLDHKGLMEAASKVNFVSHIDTALVDKALAGDKAAFLSVINQASQLGFANATAASGELIKGSLTSAQTVLKDSVLPTALRDQQVASAITEANPIFADPAVAPMLGVLKTQFQIKYPTATPAEIATLAAKYLSGMSEKIVTASGGRVLSKADSMNNDSRSGFPQRPDTDWENYFSLS